MIVRVDGCDFIKVVDLEEGFFLDLLNDSQPFMMFAVLEAGQIAEFYKVHLYPSAFLHS